MGEDERTRFRLSDEQVAAYARDGFVAGISIFDSDELIELRERVDHIQRNLAEFEPRLYEVERGFSEDPERVVCHFLGAFMVDRVLRETISDPRIAVPLAQLLGVERLRFWHDQVFYKPARHPGVVPWHQDYSYWTRTAPANHITMHIVLDDADEENGCLHFVPGSQQWGLLPKQAFDGPIDALLDHLDAERRAAFAPVPVELRAGQASIHDAHTVHGSYGNRSDRLRRSLVLNYMGADTVVADGTQPLLRGVPLLAEGALVEGPHFPVVLGPDR